MSALRPRGGLCGTIPLYVGSAVVVVGEQATGIEVGHGTVTMTTTKEKLHHGKKYKKYAVTYSSSVGTRWQL